MSQPLPLTLGLLWFVAFPLSVWTTCARKLGIIRDRDPARETDPGPDTVLGRGRHHMVDLRSVMRGLQPLARMNFVKIELAVADDADCWVSPGVGCRVIEDTIASAIRSAPCGTVLLTASSIGGQQHIRVTDDGEAADYTARDTVTRDAGWLIAQIGGSLSLESRPGAGTTVDVWLPHSPWPESTGDEE